MVETAEYSVEYTMFEENNDKHSYSPNDPLYQEQWNMKTLEMSEIWSWQESLLHSHRYVFFWKKYNCKGN